MGLCMVHLYFCMHAICRLWPWVQSPQKKESILCFLYVAINAFILIALLHSHNAIWWWTQWHPTSNPNAKLCAGLIKITARERSDGGSSFSATSKQASPTRTAEHAPLQPNQEHPHLLGWVQTWVPNKRAVINLYQMVGYQQFGW